MYIIQGLTDDASQTQTLILPDGSSALVSWYYRPQQYGWYLQSLQWNTFTITELRVVVSPNMLRQWKNAITFGLACYSNVNDREPTQQEDFLSGAFSLYILNATEVQQVEQFLAGSLNVSQ